MKNLIIILISLIVGINVSAQNYIVNLKMNPNVSPYIDEWKSGGIHAELQIMNNTFQGIEVEIGTELFYNGELVASNNIAFNENFIFLETGMNIIEAGSFLENLEFDDMAISDKESVYFNRTKRLPAGNYEICIQLIDVQTQNLLLEVIPDNPACFPAVVMSYFPPTLVFPEDNTFIRSAEASTTTFQWSPVVPFCKEEVLYEIKVYEWFPDQTKEQAALVNAPVWKTKTRETQAIFDFACLPWDESQAYVWQVQAMGDEGLSVGENDGYSEVQGFADTGRKPLSMLSNSIDDFWIFTEHIPDDVIQQGHKRTGGLGGLGTDFGVISWGENGGNERVLGSPPCLFSRDGNSIEIKYSYYFQANWATINQVDTICIQTLLYKNCNLISPSAPNLNASISYEIGTTVHTGEKITIDKSMYNPVSSSNWSIEDYRTQEELANTAHARVDVTVLIEDTAAFDPDDVYYLATSRFNHNSINSDFPINVTYNIGYPDMNTLRSVRSSLGTPEDNHIDINAIPISGTKGCAVFRGETNAPSCYVRAYQTGSSNEGQIQGN